LADDLKKALEMNKVAPEDIRKVLDAVGSLRKDIVEPRKPEKKKLDGKEEKEGKKLIEKKSEEKKDGKKPSDKNEAKKASGVG